MHAGHDPFAGATVGHYIARLDKIESTAEIAAAAAKHAAELETFWRERQGVVDAFTTRTKQSAMALEDPAALERVVGSARIVAFGEADHCVHEYLAARNLVFSTLVEKLGFATYVGETGVTDAFVVDDYINGIGTATSAQAAAAMFSWAGAVALPENVELVEWMRAYNARPSIPRKLHVYGMDFAGASNGLVVHARAAVDPVLAYLVSRRSGR
jgi:erythromycin esterase-like protein